MATPRIEDLTPSFLQLKRRKEKRHQKLNAQARMVENDWQKVREIFDSALRLAPEDRPRFVREACGKNNSLLSEVESLLSSLDGAESFMESPAVAKVADAFAAETRTFASGTRFGRYEIIRPIGSGGMGEVYLAQDLKLDRRVAVKVLNEKYSHDEANLIRFVREAKAASALNHPNILVIHEIGETDEANYIISEFIEGPTLREVLIKDKLSLGEVLELSLQIAGALATAHDAHLIHRDIKPENVMVRPDGYVKVLDFGLAKLVEQRDGTPLDPDEFRNNQTAKGMILGTMNYMSPEQAKGELIDQRTDIFSLGVVIYEMIAGRTPFAAESPSETLANLINADPQPLSPRVPKELRNVVVRMLEKNKEKRYQTMKSVLAALKALRGKPSVEAWQWKTQTGNEQATDSVPLTTNATSQMHTSFSQRLRRQKPLTVFSLAALLMGTLTIGYYWSYRKRETAVFQLGKVTKLTHNGNSMYPAISPDGTLMAFVSREAPDRLTIKLMNILTGEIKQIFEPGEYRDLVNLAFSPDGNDIYFAQSETYGNGPVRGLYRMSALRGVPTKLLTDFTWYAISRDGRHLAFGRTSRSTDESLLMIANADGTGQYKLAARKLSEQFTALSWSPNGQTIACIVGSREVSGARMGLVEVRLADGTEREITSHRWNYLGTILWLSDGGGLIVSGREKPMMFSLPWHVSYPGGEVQRLSTSEAMNYAIGSQSADSKTMTAQSVELRANIWIAPIRSGPTPNTTARQITTGNDGSYVSYMRDGRLLFTSVNSRGQSDIWTMKADLTQREQLTANAGNNTLPSASKDGRYVVFESDRAGKINIWRIDSDGKVPMQLTFGQNEKSPDVSPDGKWVVYTSADDSTLWRVRLSSGQRQQLTDHGWHSSLVSPDGKWILSNASGSGRYGILPFDGGEPVRMFDLPPGVQSNLGGRWTPDGQSFIFVGMRDGVSDIWKQPINGAKPIQLTDFKSTDQIYSPHFSPDGKEIVFSRGGWMFDVFLVNRSDSTLGN